MKKIITLFIIGFYFTCSAQDTWLQRANFGTVRQGVSSFEINNKIYIVGGWNFSVFYNETWEFDPATNIWTQKANLPGPGRRNGIAFSIGGKGYYGTGDNGTSFSNYLNDFYEYDPTIDTWVQKANFGGVARNGAVSFVLNGNGYVGTGTSSSVTYLQDMWLYNPSLNTWTPKANFTGTGRRYATSFVIGTKAYLGTGQGSTGHGNTFYEYDYLSDTWTQKTNYPPGVSTSSGFSINGKGFIVGGYNGTTYQQSVYEYNPIANSWTQKANFGGGIRGIATGISVNGKGYICAGYGAGLHNDMWEYTVSTPTAPVAAFSVPSTICIGSCINITDNSLNSPDYYTWDLTGSGTPSTSVQNPTSICYNTLGNYTVSLNVSNANGSSTLSKTLTVVSNPTVTASVTSSVICAGQLTTLSGSGATSYTWTSVSTNPTVNVTPTVTTTYTLIGKGSSNCTDTKTITVIVNPKPVINYTGVTAICSNTCSILSASGATSYTWNPGGITTNTISVCSPTSTTTYSIIGVNSNNCMNTRTISISSKISPTISAVTNNSLICAGQSATLTATGAVSYSWSSGSNTSTAVISPTSSTTYSVVGTATNSCYSTTSITQSVSTCTNLKDVLQNNSNEILIYPNPFNAKITIVLSSETETEIQVFNTLGSSIYYSKIKSEKEEIDLTKQPSGVYFIRVGLLTKKIIKE